MSISSGTSHEVAKGQSAPDKAHYHHKLQAVPAQKILWRCHGSRIDKRLTELLGHGVSQIMDADEAGADRRSSADLKNLASDGCLFSDQ